jgi:hypothetical protein
MAAGADPALPTARQVVDPALSAQPTLVSEVTPWGTLSDDHPAGVPLKSAAVPLAAPAAQHRLAVQAIDVKDVGADGMSV